MSNETFKNTNEAICGLYKVYCELCGHFLEHQKREFYTTDPFVEYILYLPAVFIKVRDPNGQSLASIYKSWSGVGKWT